MNILVYLSFLWALSGITYGDLKQRATTFSEVLNKNANADSNSGNGGKRQGKFFPVFQVVRFNNDPCLGTNGRNGSCYTQDQCTTRGGKNGGTCAGGYGICCTFDVTCGQTSNNNCTYFVSPSTLTAGVCDLTICPCGANICQLRLDFMQFVITGPTTLTTAQGSAIFNNFVSAGAGRPVSTTGQCQTDTFSVTNPGGSAPPVICGTNTAQHLYVDSSADCNNLAFQLGTAAVGATLATRAWNIKITQYSCDYNNLAPQGCDQYYFGTTTGSVQSFNYNGGNGQQLANQDQTICVRRESTNCRICWTEVKTTDFKVSGPNKSGQSGFNNPAFCCGYGTSGKATNGYDCVSIPLAQKTNAALPLVSRLVGSRICGGMLVTVTGKNSATVCSTSQPFLIRGITDQFENMIETMPTPSFNTGFSLMYTMDCPANVAG